ncbi:type II toxin-antitoxin system RelE/ParE family toxin [Pseudomonas syringae]|uniref:type II toxin-antitoxin system RelE/ParE family toxin n=1 Tax=Pseudomonas syringae TaxID=317 RepID=UPI0012AEC767|nr:type II toxin-antitoxin system RelE/ParE family toxin [Pseudomonas syringae]
MGPGVILRLTRKASSDLDGIYEHYKELLGSDQAKAVVNDVVHEAKALQEPGLASTGRPTDVPAVREFIHQRWPFLTSFQVTAGSVEILRFLHQNGQPLNQPLFQQDQSESDAGVSASGLRTYAKVVDGVTYNVPRGINRDAKGNAWIVRAIKDKQLILSERFNDARFGGTLRALECAIGHLTHSGHAWQGSDVLTLNQRSTVHWRKRSGVGLCAVAYVTSKGPGRGETFFLSTYKRVASGKGLDKLRSKMLTVLQHAYRVELDCDEVPQWALEEMGAELDRLWRDVAFAAFLAAGKRKADQIAVADYLGQTSGTC